MDVGLVYFFLVQPTLTIQSMALVVYSDQRVQIYCRINSNSKFSQWSFAPVHNSTPIVLVSEEAGLHLDFQKRYDFKREDADVLTIVRAQQQDAGRYTCKKVRNRSNISEVFTEIIVLCKCNKESVEFLAILYFN